MTTMSNAALDLVYTARLLETWAEASAVGEIVCERELDDGAWLVTTKWPSRLAFREHAAHLEAPEAMLEVSRLPH